MAKRLVGVTWSGLDSFMAELQALTGNLVDEFPRTPSGKVQKFVLRRCLQDGDLDAPAGTGT